MRSRKVNYEMEGGDDGGQEEHRVEVDGGENPAVRAPEQENIKEETGREMTHGMKALVMIH